MGDSKKLYKNIGQLLKFYRETKNESLAEVSGAVEIDIDTLHRIETGVELPSEDILLLLISHFDLEEAAADKLLEMANYPSLEGGLLDAAAAKQIMMLIAMPNHAAYAEQFEVIKGQEGLIIQFSQPGAGGQATPVSKVALSPKIAHNLAQAINDSLKPVKPKLLNTPKKRSRK